MWCHVMSFDMWPRSLLSHYWHGRFVKCDDMWCHVTCDMWPCSWLSHYRNGVVQMGWMVGKEFIFIFIISLSTRKASLLIFGWLDGREVTFWMKCPFLHFHFEVLTMLIFFSQVLAQMRSTGDVNPGHYSKTIAQVVTLIFLSRSKRISFSTYWKSSFLKAHGLTLSCPELYMGLHDTLATAIQVQLAELMNMVEFVKNLKI